MLDFRVLSSKHGIRKSLRCRQKHVFSDGWLKAFHKFIKGLGISDYRGSKLQTKVPVCFSILLNRSTLHQVIKLVLQTPFPIQVSKLTVQLKKQQLQIQILQITTSCLTPIHPPSQSFPFKQGHSKPCLIIAISQPNTVTIFTNLKLPLQQILLLPRKLARSLNLNMRYM